MSRRSRAGAQVRPRQVGWLLRCAVLILFILLYGLPLIALLFRPARWVLAQCVGLANGIGLAAAALVVVAVGTHVLQRVRPAPASVRQSSDLVHSRGRRSVKRWGLVVGFAALAVGGEMATNLAATDVHDNLAARFPHAAEFYANHDIAKLVGQTVRVMLLRAGELAPAERDRERLFAIANAVPPAWQRLAEAQDERIVPLTERELWAFVQDPRRPVLDVARWGGLLDEWAHAAGLAPLDGPVRLQVIGELSSTFAVSWREALKHDYEHGGKAWAAMQLDMMGELLRRSTRDAPVANPAMQRALANVAAEMPALEHLVTQVRLDQSGYHDQVLARFDDIHETLAGIAGQFASIKKDTEQIREQTAKITLLVEAMGNKMLEPAGGTAPGFTPEAMAAIRELERSDEPEAAAVAAVARLAWTCDPVDGKKARAALAAWAVALKPDAMPAPEKACDYYTLKGDLFYYSDQFDDAIDPYRRAFAIRSDDWRVRNDLALALARLTGTGWAAHQREAAEILRGTLQQTGLGSTGEVQVRKNLALILHDQGDLRAAREQLEQALKIARQPYGPWEVEHPSLSMCYMEYAIVVGELGDLAMAKDFAKRGLALARKRCEDDDPVLASYHRNLALILDDLGDEVEARRQMEAAIAIDAKNHAQHDHRGAATYHALARMLRSQNDLAGALEAVNQAIAIDEAYVAPDHPRLANDYSTLALILKDRGDLAGARDRMQQAIAIRKKNFAPDDVQLAKLYYFVARIEEDDGNLGEAVRLWRTAYPILLEKLGPEHANTKAVQEKLSAHDANP